MSQLKSYEIGLRELGIKEIPGIKSNPRVDEYFDATGVPNFTDNESWCAAFISWCWRQAGYAYNVALSARARSWLNNGKKIKWKIGDDMLVGAVGVIPRGAPGSGQGHVFMFQAWVEGSNRMEFWALEGNAKDQVQIGKHRSSEILGWVWPSEVPFPIANQSLPSSGIIKAAVGTGIAGVTALGSSSTEVFDAIAKAKTIGTGSVIAMVAGFIVVATVVLTIVLRARQKKDEKAIGQTQTET